MRPAPPARPSRRHLRAVATASLLIVTGCGWWEAGEDTLVPLPTPPSTVVDTTTTTAPTTDEPAASDADRRRAPRRTTTTLPPLGVPVPPPPPRAPEPEVVIGSIEIPAIGVVEALYSGITLTTLDRGPGHWPGTAMPGQWGNTVVAGHRVSESRPFRDLDRLVAGDRIVFTTADGRFEYAVTGTEIVGPDAMWITEQTYDHRATLFACHPPGSVRYRIAVFADLVRSA